MDFENLKPQINADERRLNALSEDIIGVVFGFCDDFVVED